MEYSDRRRYPLPPLPPGWVQTIDPITGQTYYANATTGESSWDIPQMVVPPPPPPPPAYGFPHIQQPQQQQQQHDQIYHHYDHQIVHLPSSDMNYSANGSYAANHFNESMYPEPQVGWANVLQQQTSHPSETGQMNNGIVMYTRNQNSDDEINAALRNNTVVDDDTSKIDVAEETIVDPIDTELRLFTPGQIADRCHVQQEQLQAHYMASEDSSTVRFAPYESPLLKPNHLHFPVQQQQRQNQEMGRLHTRYFTLREQLKQYHIFD
jgi:WW domain